MNSINRSLKLLNSDLTETKKWFLDRLQEFKTSVHIYTHLDADGLSSGAILGKALYRENIPFQISVLRQLEREEIVKIVSQTQDTKNFLIFSDFGSGQYLELIQKLNEKNGNNPFIILDHHLPQNISNKDDEKIKEIYKNSRHWHINPYFYDVDGSSEISGAGLCYFFAKILNEKNIDLSPIALVGATGDIQSRGPDNSFTGLNSKILEHAIAKDLVEEINDLNFSPIKPLNEAISYSRDINLPGLSDNTSKMLKFLKSLGILMENSDGSIRTLNDLNQDEKQKVSSAIIEYISLKLDIEPSEIIKKLIINRYILKNELVGSELHDLEEFSSLLNSCGRSNNGSLGIAIAMGDRRMAYNKAKDHLINYRKSLVQSLTWLKEKNKIQNKSYIQFFFGEEVIPENIIGTISSMLIFGKSGDIDLSKPVFGCAKRKDEDVYKISGRAHESIVKKGVNLSEAIREALELSDLKALGGGHPPAAGTKVPIDKIDIFLENCNIVIKKQLGIE
ncbi:MAG: DHH family phosphoesterase [Candidatus Lokiarchaeota archaeon]|nr:DHH family phosphoesterase [Candidatus Lokiarchaeota archaeon]